MITFRNDEDRANFQITMALTMLRNEVRFGLLACDPRKGTTVRTLRRYWPDLKKTVRLPINSWWTPAYMNS